MSDGVSVFECTSDDEVIDLLRGGQGVFGIALGGVWRDIEGTLAKLPGGVGDGRKHPDPRRVVDAAADPRGRLALRPAGVRLAAAANAVRERPARLDDESAGAEGATSPEPLRQTEPHSDGDSGARVVTEGERMTSIRGCALTSDRPRTSRWTTA